MIENKDFTDIILTHKTLYFSEEILTEPENYPLKLVVTKAGIRWFTVDFDKYPMEGLLDVLKKQCDSTPKNTWEDSLTCLNNIIDFFTQDGKKLNYNTNKFLTEHLSISLLRDFIGCDTAFLFTYLQENKADEVDSIFLNGLISISFEADFSIELVINLFKKVIDLQNNIHLKWVPIIFELASQNTDKAKNIIQILKIDLDTKYDELISQLIGGVCSTSFIENKEFFNHLYKEDKFQPTVLWAMTRIKLDLNENNILKMLDLAETNNKEIATLCNLVRLYIIVWESNLLKEKVGFRCFEGIKKLLIHENQNVLYYFLENITHYSNLPEEKVCELLKIFLQNPNHPASIFSANGSNVYAFDWCINKSFKSPKYFFEILLSFINDTSHVFNTGIFQQSLPEVLKKYPEESIRFILTCLTDYKGKLRLLGHRLMEELLEYHPKIRLGDGLKNLSIEQQTILVLSISIPQTLRFSKLFRLVVPILEMGEESVQQLIVKTLFENIFQKEDLTEAIKEELSDGELKNELLAILNQIDEQNNKIFTKKRELKEFNPSYSQYKIFNHYSKIFYGFLDKKIQHIHKEKSIMKFLGNTIILLKGGGFKSEFNSNFTPLTNIGHSVSIPQSAFLDSEEEIFNNSLYFNENWETAKDWQKWLRKS
ncbi:hypothetical protein VB264_14710 [Arcicella aquatica]|uniref:Uncharacterized protein n=1 Tax=Arcicella aquatica TaxID=217141 RepID=A0ABU5QQK4_9BACT|nr:hypothetical protein [Arcicella aquatica]MEA5259045.1 hypothetical protein [Arcicella aquatica]